MTRPRREILFDLYKLLTMALFMDETRWLNTETNRIEMRNPDLKKLHEVLINTIKTETLAVDELVTRINAVNVRLQRYDTPVLVKALVDELIDVCGSKVGNQVCDTRSVRNSR